MQAPGTEMLITWGRLRDLKSIEESKTLVSLEDMKKLNAKPTVVVAGTVKMWAGAHNLMGQAPGPESS